MNGFLAPAIGDQIDVLLPYLVVAGGGLLVMLVDAFVRSLEEGPPVVPDAARAAGRGAGAS